VRVSNKLSYLTIPVSNTQNNNSQYISKKGGSQQKKEEKGYIEENTLNEKNISG
jgi:hypothetical protein